VRPDEKKIVLIVDDEEPLRKLSRRILEKAGYGVLLASGSREALVISRGYSEQIHMLLSDVEMPGMNGIALGCQITTERPGIAVLLNSANPSYAGETQFAFLAKPYTPDKLQIAIAQTLESQPQALAPVELEAIPSVATEGSHPRPEIGTPEMPMVEAGATLLGEELSHAFAEDQVLRDSTAALPEPEKGFPEVVTLIGGDHRNSSKIDLSTTRITAARNLAIAVRERKSRWRLPHRVPVWVPAAAALVLAIVPFSLHQINEGRSARPYTVRLQGVRGLTGEADAPTDTPLLLNLDVASLPRSDSYEIQIVNGDGHTLWEKVVPPQGSEIRTRAAALRRGTYFVRVYGPARELLKEYALRVTEAP
jgi:CheY-like chemotaxis protein